MSTTTDIYPPKLTMARQYTTASMPTRGSYFNEKVLLQHEIDHGYYSTSDENLLISQPLPNTVKIVNEKPTSNKKDSVLLGCLVACFLCVAVKNERT